MEVETRHKTRKRTRDARSRRHCCDIENNPGCEPWMMQTHAESKCDHDTSSRAILDVALPHSVVRIDPATMLSYLKHAPNTKAANPDPDFHCLAVSWFLVITAVGFVTFAYRREKG